MQEKDVQAKEKGFMIKKLFHFSRNISDFKNKDMYMCFGSFLDGVDI